MKIDSIDRVNDFWCVYLISACALGAFVVRFFPALSVVCWTPPPFTQPQVAYSETSAFLTESFPPIVESMNLLEEKSLALKKSYHLWIPLVLFLQALAFTIPRALTSLVEFFASRQIFNMDDLASKLSNPDAEKTEVVKKTAKLMGQFLRNNSNLMTLSYLGKKILLCVNLLAQIVFLQVQFKSGRHVDLGLGNRTTSEAFFAKDPVLNDFSILRHENVIRYTLQCRIPVCEVYDKLFIFLFYWLLFVAVLTLLSLAFWVIYVTVPCFFRSRIVTYLKSENRDLEDEDVDSFVKHFLGFDGILTIHFLSLKGCELQSAELVNFLWDDFKEKRKEKEDFGKAEDFSFSHSAEQRT